MWNSGIKLFQVLLFYFILGWVSLWLSFAHKCFSTDNSLSAFEQLLNHQLDKEFLKAATGQKMSDILIMHNKYSFMTQIECKGASCHFFTGRVVLWRTVQVQMGGGAQGGNSSGGEVWTFSSGCCPVWEAANVKKAWLWIPHWDGLGPEGMPANLQPALLPENSCSLHLPAPHGGYLREVRPTPPFQERSSFVMSEEFRFLKKSMWIVPIHFSGLLTQEKEGGWGGIPVSKTVYAFQWWF